MTKLLKRHSISAAIILFGLAGCDVGESRVKCIEVPIGYVYPYDLPYDKYGSTDPFLSACSSFLAAPPELLSTNAGSKQEPHTLPGPAPKPSQVSVAGGGVAAAVEGKETAYAGGGRAGADDGHGPIDVAALRPEL